MSGVSSVTVLRVSVNFGPIWGGNPRRILELVLGVMHQGSLVFSRDTSSDYIGSEMSFAKTSVLN